MTEENYIQLTALLEFNSLYRKSKSVHKIFQLRQFIDYSTDKPLEGIQIRREDASCVPEGFDSFDESTSRFVMYTFKNGVLQSNNNEPAIQYPGHWEYWNNGVLQKVVADNGDTEEYWQDGVPKRIERNILYRRKHGEII